MFVCLVFFSPLTKVKLINELNEREANLGVKESVSWHTEYKDSAWIFVGEIKQTPAASQTAPAVKRCCLLISVFPCRRISIRADWRWHHLRLLSVRTCTLSLLLLLLRHPERRVDCLCVLLRYGEIVNINLVRDKKTGKSKGFCFICYEDQRSTILAVDNFNSIKVTRLLLHAASCFCGLMLEVFLLCTVRHVDEGLSSTHK